MKLFKGLKMLIHKIIYCVYWWAEIFSPLGL